MLVFRGAVPPKNMKRCQWLNKDFCAEHNLTVERPDPLTKHRRIPLKRSTKRYPQCNFKRNHLYSWNPSMKLHVCRDSIKICYYNCRNNLTWNVETNGFPFQNKLSKLYKEQGRLCGFIFCKIHLYYPPKKTLLIALKGKQLQVLHD